MATTASSTEARAAARFSAASRRVETAFRIVRKEAYAGACDARHTLALRQLEDALNELAQAEEEFDATLTFDPKTTN
ncbi:hypothetical protein [Paraburkholderia caribensis]|uniref:hypothetical protein n=1 Tax=Paraburkholderia caribensis TaxID=75105 RepID=UPI001CB0896B|nr:hypothetical protein [Paraburkholderia caribensis]CAG9250740.1 conserved hypothetical protein [Paraburkholderia caribensis]